MPRPLLKTAATSLKMTPEVRDLWERCAATENRSLTNMFEVLVRDHAKKLGLHKPKEAAGKPAAKGASFKKAKK